MLGIFMKSFYMPVQKKKKKSKQNGLRVSNFALSMVLFKWHHDSEGVNLQQQQANIQVKCHS